MIVATGGLSYPSTGSTGDGFSWAREAGHQVTELLPALVPFVAEEAEDVFRSRKLRPRRMDKQAFSIMIMAVRLISVYRQ